MEVVKEFGEKVVTLILPDTAANVAKLTHRFKFKFYNFSCQLRTSVCEYMYNFTSGTDHSRICELTLSTCESVVFFIFTIDTVFGKLEYGFIIIGC